MSAHHVGGASGHPNGGGYVADQEQVHAAAGHGADEADGYGSRREHHAPGAEEDAHNFPQPEGVHFDAYPRPLDDDIEICRRCNTWSELANRALARLTPVSGRTRLEDGTIHYWLRLPMANDDGTVDTVLCHDRYLDPELGDDPDAACKEANRRLRLDTHGLLAAA